jgi:mycothiol system anti-sigma-R factor
MLCRDVKRVVYFFLDETLGDRSKQNFSSHVGVCSDCDQRVRVHSKLRSLVKSRLARVVAPEHLKTRLTRSIRAFRTEWSQP